MIISVLFWPAGSAFLALFLARIVPRLRCDKSDLDGFNARFFRVDWKPRIHSCSVSPNPASKARDTGDSPP